jgi:hypothetical protein
LLTHAAIATAVHASEVHLALQRRSLFEPLERVLSRCAAEWRSTLMPLTSRPSWNDRTSSSSPRSAGHSSTSSVMELELPSPSAVGTGTGTGDASPQSPVGHHHHHRERSSSLLPSEEQRILAAAAAYLRAVDEAVQAALEGNNAVDGSPGASSNAHLLLLSASGLIHVLSSHHWSAVPGEGFAPLAAQLSTMAAAELPGLQAPNAALRSPFGAISPEHTADTAFVHSLRHFVAQLQSALASCVSRALPPVPTAAASSVPAAAVAAASQQLQSRSPLPPLQFPTAVVSGASLFRPLRRRRRRRRRRCLLVRPMPSSCTWNRIPMPMPMMNPSTHARRTNKGNKIYTSSTPALVSSFLHSLFGPALLFTHYPLLIVCCACFVRVSFAFFCLPSPLFLLKLVPLLFTAILLIFICFSSRCPKRSPHAMPLDSLMPPHIGGSKKRIHGAQIF